jgi:hypothetical protein
MGFLRWQKANSSAKDKKRIDKELAARDALVRCVEQEQVDIDAIAVVVGVK